MNPTLPIAAPHSAASGRCSAPRRAFLKKAALGLASIPILPGLLAASPQPTATARCRIAVGLNGFESGKHKYKKPYILSEIVEFLSREGFQGVELVNGALMGSYPGSSETDRITAARRQYEEKGLKVFSIQLGGGGAFAPDAAVRSRWLEEFGDRLLLAKQLGCECIGIWPGGPLGNQTLDQAIQRLGESFRAAAAFAEPHKILVSFEIEPPFIFNTEQHLTAILAAANHRNLKTIYDPSHFDLMTGSTGFPHRMLARVGVPNIGYIHLTDTDGTLRDGGTSKHLACGDGHAHIPDSLRMLKDGGFRGWIMLDTWEVPDPYDACRKGLAMVRSAGLLA